MVLVRCEPTDDQRESLYKLVLEFFGKTPAASDTAVVVEFAGELAEVERLIKALQPFGIKEIVRTGLVAIKVD
jgi:acetolactate synthase-1/3 small subunit